MRIKGFIYRSRYIIAAFAVPAVLVAAAFAVTGIFPFGDKQIAVIDMYHQYVPFLSELQYKLHNGGSLFYTWHGACGSNFWNLLSYYGASPLNLFLILFPEKLIMEGITLLLIVKIGLAGSFMATYLRYLDRREDWAVVAFSTLYALCSYVMAYYWCIMWIDAVALLPLCILGLNRLMDRGSPVLYTVALAVTVFCNYYVAIMVCIFILFYYPVLYFTKFRGLGARHCAVTTLKSAGFSLLGVLMSSVMLLPAYISMQSTYYISSEFPAETVFYDDAADVINQMLPYSELTFRDGLPNLYCGIFVVMLLVFYAAGRSFSTREKLINLAFAGFLFLSLNINRLDFIWHGFHFPNQLPFRYTFVIAFFLTGIAYRAFRKIGEVETRTIWTLMGAGIAYYIFAQKVLTENIEDMDLFFYGGITWLVIYTAALIIFRRDMITKRSFALLILVVTAAELLSSLYCAFDLIGNTYRSSYFHNYDDVRTLVERNDDGPDRMEMDACYILNCPALYHYNGVSQFSSSLNSDTSALMEKIGLDGNPGKNRFSYMQKDPVSNAMLNVRYLIGKNMILKDPDFRQVDMEGNSRLYENDYPLGAGYMTGTEIRTWDTSSDNPFDVLEEYVTSATSNTFEDLFIPVPEPEITASNAGVSQKAHEVVNVSLKDSSAHASAVFRFRSDKTQKYYVYMEAENADELVVYTDENDKSRKIHLTADCGSIVNIGEIKKGETFSIRADYKEGCAGKITYHVRTLDYGKWEKAYAALSEHVMDVTDSGDTFIEGVIDAGDGGMFVSSVPYDKGWKLEVDGREREIYEKAGGVFISTALDEGTHRIKLSFTPPGFAAGAAVSVISAGALAAAAMYRRRRMKIRISTDVSDHEEDDRYPPGGYDCNER